MQSQPSTPAFIGDIVLRPIPRAYQTAACAGIERDLATCRSTLVNMPTGTGKSVVAAMAAAHRCALLGGTLLFLVHREELAAQMAEHATRAGLCVGVEMAAQRDGTTAQMVLDGRGRPNMIVASVQTLSSASRLARFAAMHDVHSVFVDEAHHAVAPSYRRILAAFPAAKIVGFTATADRADKKGLYEVFESVAFTMDLREAIAAGWLVPIRAKQITSAEFDLSHVRSRSGDLDAGDLAIVYSRDAALHAVAGPLSKLIVGLPTILFVCGKQTAHDMAEVLAGYGVVARAIDADTDRQVRAATIAAFKRGEVHVLVNDSIFVEGFDAPIIACVAIARPTASRARYSQMVGRGTRPSPGKTELLLLDFVDATSKHNLCGPIDLLGGAPLSERERELAEQELRNGADLITAERRAKEVIAAEDLRASLAAQDVARQQRARVYVEVQAFARLVDPFGPPLGTDNDGPRCTARQRDYLNERGIPADDDVSHADASRLITALVSRSRRGLCTAKQAKALSRNGCDPSSSFADASQMLTALRNNHWRIPRDWLRSADGYYAPPEVSHVA